MMRGWLPAIILALTPVVGRASPPPPPPEYIDAAAQLFVADVTPETFERSVAIWADNLHVIVNGNEVASDKATWVKQEAARIGKVDRHVFGYAEGYGSVLIVDQYDDRSQLPVRPGILFDARFRSRSTLYEFGPDHRVHTIRSTDTDGFWRSTAPRP